MWQMKRWWHFLLQEPFIWLFYYLFQPAKFKRDFEAEDLLNRFIVMLRLALPMFLCSFMITLVTRIVLNFAYPGFYFYPLATGIPRFVYDTAWSTAFGVVGGMVGVIIISTTSNITLSFAVSVVTGSIVNIGTTREVGAQALIVSGIIYGITCGLLFGLTVGSNQRTGMSNVISNIVGGIVGSIVGVVIGLFFGFLAGLFVGFVGSKTFIGASSTEDTPGALVGCIVGVFAVGFIGTTVKSLARHTRGNLMTAIAAGRSIGILFGILMGIVGGAIGELAISRGILAEGFAYNTSSGISLSFSSGTAFLVTYLLSYYRLPLYPVSSLSSIQAYRASRRKPTEVFHYLDRSSLYWDERVFLPLPRLKEMLLIAAHQDIQRTLEEIAFIVAERPQQTVEAREAVFAIAISDLEQRRTLPEIAQASQRLTKVLLPEVRQTDARWLISLTSLSDASRNAALCSSPISRQARQKALDEMILNLNNVRPDIAFEDVKLNKRLQAIVKQWMTVALQEVGKLKNMPNLLGSIDNPYVSGQSLKLGDSSFVGRQDLAQQLEQALSRGKNRPTFFLTGERRMGKTSTLNQLPRLLSARYLPIYYDLQLRGISSNSAAFLSTIAGDISAVMQKRGLKIRKLEYTHLYDANRENAAAPYRLFDEWFRELEDVLAQDDLTILLTFDEFEKLQEAKEANYLDLKLLLDWFRSVIQNRPRLALLFSGVRGLGDMGRDWAGYFVNAQLLKVGFLSKPEARRLILRPVPDYPSEQIFDEAVVEEIMRVSGCHPFLVQAMCSKLIDLLNIDNRDWAELPDVSEAMYQVLDSWWHTYFQDLWERTTLEQQACLFALQKHSSSTLAQLVQQSRLEEKTVRNTLTMLLRRDLILREQDTYRISAPIFSEWVERYS
jgi:hypothetical protein